MQKFIGRGETGVLGENYGNCATPSLAAIARQYGRTKEGFARFIVAYYRLFRPVSDLERAAEEDGGESALDEEEEGEE